MADVVKAASLEETAHGFLGRRGGVSTGQYASLNVGTGSPDLPRAVEANRTIAADAVLPGAELATVYQVHSADVVRIDTPFPMDARPHADAMVTDRPGVLLGILTADCAPVLLADADAGVIGAAHAGWRGAFAGICANTVAAMEELGANRGNIRAAIGPCIAQASYEVDEGFYLRFLAEDEAFERFFKPGRAGHHQFDLAAFVAADLARAGVSRVEITGLDTYADEDRYFSYRRATQAGEDGYGRQISLIGL
ncbi:peptidoglycan editing factor PgeF [Croceicoccus bisphenolivorans]|uniref:peptidoglycan editing factor PgeF n=1 Tax=Croceicoccus bisphenolivorans TaxID=1783232 RepID=UPI00082C2720|nr:peptidoglycan editing factor PgeF [Croceicoccus bisphenolivorans]